MGSSDACGSSIARLRRGIRPASNPSPSWRKSAEDRWSGGRPRLTQGWYCAILTLRHTHEPGSRECEYATKRYDAPVNEKRNGSRLGSRAPAPQGLRSLQPNRSRVAERPLPRLGLASAGAPLRPEAVRMAPAPADRWCTQRCGSASTRRSQRRKYEPHAVASEDDRHGGSSRLF